VNAPYDHAREGKVPQHHVFTVCEAEAIHEARLVIEQARERLIDAYVKTSSNINAFDYGRAVTMLEQAESGLFGSLNYAQSYGSCPNAGRVISKWHERQSVHDRLDVLVAPSEV